MMNMSITLLLPLLLSMGQDYSKLQDVKAVHYARAPGYSEGPTWKQGELFFCSGALLRIGKEGRIDKFLDINPAGTILKANGNLLICDNKYKAILEYTTNGILSVLADSFDGKPLNSLNDLTLDSRGNIYWTDPAGSSLAKPTGNIFMLDAKGNVSKVASGLAFPNGLDVDPQNRFLYVIESQSKKILRYPLPLEGMAFGKPEDFYDLGGSGGDGCAFDENGNLWVADFQRPETKQGRIIVVSPDRKVLGHVTIPASVVSNIAFGGNNHDEIFCTSGTPDGVFHAKVGIKGFKGHPGVSNKVQRKINLGPEEAASPVHSTKFGFPGGIGTTRGWYIWKSFDPKSMEAIVTRESSDEPIKTRVLPWMTTYRHLVYGTSPADLLEGERVNLFFNADENHPRGYLVHYQDEICQMKGHNHIYRAIEDSKDGKNFKAMAMAGDKPLDGSVLEFCLAPDAQKWSKGKLVDNKTIIRGDLFYLTWCTKEQKRLVMHIIDEDSLGEIKSNQQKKVDERLAKDGLEGYFHHMPDNKILFVVYATYWTQANQLKPGDAVKMIPPKENGKGIPPISLKVVSQKNRGTYGSGFNEVVLEVFQGMDISGIAKYQFTSGFRLAREMK